MLGFTLGPVIAFGLEFLRGLPNVRGTTRRHSPTSRYLTAPTWTGMRTIDLHNLRSVKAWLVSGRFGSTMYVIVTDAAGVRMSFSNKQDLELIRHAVRWHLARRDAPPVQVSSLAASAVGLRPRSRGQEVLRAFGSIVPLALAILAIGGVITALASA